MMASKPKRATQGRLGREQAERLPVAGATWQVWTADENEDAAAATFARRHGSHPEHVVDFGGYLWLGPVPGLEGEVCDAYTRRGKCTG